MVAANDTSREVRRYPYHDRHGQVLYWRVRFEPKSFRPQMPDGSWRLDCMPVLYRLPLIMQAIDHDTEVFLVEGEKDADRLIDAGLIATTVGASSAWNSTETTPLRFANSVTILPDNDEAGLRFATSAARELYPHVEVKVVHLPGLPDKGDVSDWLNDGHTITELIALWRTQDKWTPVRRRKHKRRRGHQRGRQRSKTGPGLPYALEDIVWTLGGRTNGDNGIAYCPAHDDASSHTLGLSLTAIEDERTLAFCHSGCDFPDIASAIEGIMSSNE